ncbi:hypothetical protein Btru_013637 [Bulinus truncatus]|nr:hypothetical protein Btru_013637 [Bulinus truncatus]
MVFHVERSLAQIVFGALVIFFCSNSVTAQSCTGYWTGPSCKYKCTCKAPVCHSNGTCKSGGCQNLFFGSFCQYYDIKAFGESQDYTLLDSDEETCLRPGTTSVEVLKKNGPLRFFRVVANNILGIKAFTFAAYHVPSLSNTNNRTPVNCSENRFYTVRTDNMFVRDFYCCVKEEVVNMITFTGEGVQYFCDVHISGGRNLGLRQSINSTTVLNTTVKPENVLDGGAPDKIELSTCYISGNPITNKKQAVTVTLKDPVLISYFRVFNYPDINLFHKFKNFVIETFSDKNELVATFTDINVNPIMIYVPSHRQPDSLVKYVRLSIPGPTLHFCEIEIFGGIVSWLDFNIHVELCCAAWFVALVCSTGVQLCCAALVCSIAVQHFISFGVQQWYATWVCSHGLQHWCAALMCSLNLRKHR